MCNSGLKSCAHIALATAWLMLAVWSVKFNSDPSAAVCTNEARGNQNWQKMSPVKASLSQHIPESLTDLSLSCMYAPFCKICCIQEQLQHTLWERQKNTTPKKDKNQLTSTPAQQYIILFSNSPQFNSLLDSGVTIVWKWARVNLSLLTRLWHFSSSINSFFKCACTSLPGG